MRFEYLAVCVADINECSVNNRCTSGQICVNTAGSYICVSGLSEYMNNRRPFQTRPVIKPSHLYYSFHFACVIYYICTCISCYIYI